MFPTKTAAKKPSVATNLSSIPQKQRPKPSLIDCISLPARQARVCEASPSHSLPANTQACSAGNTYPTRDSDIIDAQKTYRGTNDQSICPLLYPVELQRPERRQDSNLQPTD
jgi:hypothetical protein